MEKKEALNTTIEHLKKGGIILFPADTIWGLSCDATNEEAVKKIAQLKGRDDSKSFIVLLNSDRMVNQCFKDVPEVAWDMMDFAEGPLTLVLDGGQYVASSVINKDGSLGIRKVSSGDIHDLIYKFNRPIVSTSANFSGKASPLLFSEIDEKLKSKVDFIYPLNRSNDKKSTPSKIVRIKTNGEVEILRK